MDVIENRATPMKAGSKWSVPIEAMRAIKPEYRQHLKILKSPGTPRAPLTPASAYQGQEGRKKDAVIILIMVAPQVKDDA